MQGVLAFSEALIFATFLASSPRGVVLPFRLGGGGFGPDGLALGFALGQELPSRPPSLGFSLVEDYPPRTLAFRRGLSFGIRGWCGGTSDFVIGGMLRARHSQQQASTSAAYQTQRDYAFADQVGWQVQP